ncbi:RNA recognition motif domain [Macleaya cordata]|uniref:RNA recognition motif domain n=1 Tax=Macleaya cordata TaxID=56857 RepID=A0A200Q8X2_MACCD|nr:RNA recognition motif domain [Macleaya cordata]
MDAYEATRIVFSRIQSLDPENASKIMGLLLIQDHGEKEMIRLAFGPEALLHSLVLKARNDLGLSSNTPSTPSTPSSPSPFFSTNSSTNPISISISRQNSSSSFPLPPSRMHNNNNNNNNNLTSPSSLSINSSSWAPSTFSDLQTPDDLLSPNSNSYVATINGFSALGSSSSDFIDEFQLQDQLSFLNDGPKNSDLFYPPQPPELATSPNNGSTDGMLFPSYAANWGAAAAMNNGNHHRRSSSVTDMINLGGLSSDPLGTGLGWKPCLYYARGYCKNGTTCRFLHDSTADPNGTTMVVGSPNKLDAMEQCQELLLRSSKTHQQQQQQQQLRLSTASQLMASAAAFPYTASSAAAGKCMNFLLQQQQQNDTQRAAAAAAALMLGEDVHKFGRARMERNEFSSSGGGGGGMVNPGSRQIYLTFPADSSFREEDVSNYFSIYGPVQDVRIPYQQKRMFGFVTFVYPETVKLILAKGNPHFVCDARVLVKPYKEKGKVPDKKQQQQQQQLERGDFSSCTTPTGLDSRGDPYDLQLGARMFNNTQDVLLRRKLEEQQADLQQAMELQGRRLMGLQLLDVKKHHHHHHHHHRNLSAGAVINIPSPTQLHSPYMINHSLIPPSSLSDRSSPEFPEEINCGSPATTIDPPQLQRQNLMNAGNNKEELFFGDDINGNGSGSDGKESPKLDDCSFHDSLEHNLPDSPFASPIKSGGDPPSFFSSTSSMEAVAAAAAPSSSSSSSSSLITSTAIMPATSTLDMASLKSCFFQIPRFSSDHGAIGM